MMSLNDVAMRQSECVPELMQRRQVHDDAAGERVAADIAGDVHVGLDNRAGHSIDPRARFAVIAIGAVEADAHHRGLSSPRLLDRKACTEPPGSRSSSPARPACRRPVRRCANRPTQESPSDHAKCADRCSRLPSATERAAVKSDEEYAADVNMKQSLVFSERRKVLVPQRVTSGRDFALRRFGGYRDGLARRKMAADCRITVAGCLGVAALGHAQFTSFSDHKRALLEGNWQSCREERRAVRRAGLRRQMAGHRPLRAAHGAISRVRVLSRHPGRASRPQLVRQPAETLQRRDSRPTPPARAGTSTACIWKSRSAAARASSARAGTSRLKRADTTVSH